MIKENRLIFDHEKGPDKKPDKKVERSTVIPAGQEDTSFSPEAIRRRIDDRIKRDQAEALAKDREAFEAAKLYTSLSPGEKTDTKQPLTPEQVLAKYPEFKPTGKDYQNKFSIKGKKIKSSGADFHAMQKKLGIDARIIFIKNNAAGESIPHIVAQWDGKSYVDTDTKKKVFFRNGGDYEVTATG